MKLYRIWLDFIDEKRRKVMRASDLEYKEQLLKAFQNNKKLNLSIPEFNINNSHFDSSMLKPLIEEVIHHEIYSLPQKDISFNCLNITIKTHEVLRERLNINSLITLGSISDSKNEHKIFYESFSKLKYRFNHPELKTEKINLHAWLTLEDYYIVDVSLLSSLKEFDKHPELDYRLFYYMNALTQSNSGNFYRYHPILVGDEFLIKLK